MFSCRRRLQLLWKLFVVCNWLIMFHLICGVKPLLLSLQKLLERPTWFIIEASKNECLWLQNHCFQRRAEIPMYTSFIINIFFWKMLTSYATFPNGTYLQMDFWLCFYNCKRACCHKIILIIYCYISQYYILCCLRRNNYQSLH